MFLHIDPASDLAIYEQVVRQVKFAVASDVLTSGDMAPSVRELARELAINPNTVARAYRELQADGVLLPVRGTGLTVAPGAAESCRLQRLRMIGDRLRQVLREAQQSRLDSVELRALVENEMKSLEREED